MITLNLHTRIVETVEHLESGGIEWLRVQDGGLTTVNIHGDKQFVTELEASFRSYLKRIGRELPPREDAMEPTLVTEVL